MSDPLTAVVLTSGARHYIPGPAGDVERLIGHARRRGKRSVRIGAATLRLDDIERVVPPKGAVPLPRPCP